MFESRSHPIRRMDHAAMFKPIFSLGTGRLHGYRILIRAEEDKLSSDPSCAETTRYGLLFDDENVRTILGMFSSLPRHVALMIPIRATGIEVGANELDTIITTIRAAGLSPRQIVLEVECAPVSDWTQFARHLDAARQNGFRFSVDCLWNGYPWVHVIAAVRPDYMWISPTLAHQVGEDSVKVNAVETLVHVARSMNSRVVADGISNQHDLDTLVHLGVDFAVGGLLEEQIYHFRQDSPEDPRLDLRLATHIRYSSVQAFPLKNVVKAAKTVHERTLVEDVVAYFNVNPLETGVVIVRDEQPIGLVIRERLFQRLASKYGYSLYGNKEIYRLLENDPLVVELDTPLETVSRLAMARDSEHVYDEVIVTHFGQLMGVVTVQDIMNTLTTAQLEFARDANPLTGLPGNRRIEQEITSRIHLGSSFAIIYTDLDNFKWFNDKYGFQRGDAVIAFTSNVLKEIVQMYGQSHDFVGHIGGDDFIVLTESKEAPFMCQAVIERFEREVAHYYPMAEHDVRMLEVTDRKGRKVQVQGLTISLSVLECDLPKAEQVSLERIAFEAGKLKKKAKDTSGSVYVQGPLPPT